MPSKYPREFRDCPYEARMKNLAKARNSPRYHPPQPWRSQAESLMIRRFVFWWYTSRDTNKPSGRNWAKQLGVSHHWVQKLVKEFRANPEQAYKEMSRYGDPTIAKLEIACERTRKMKEAGELRSLRREKMTRI